MQLACRREMEDTVVFSSPAIISPLREHEREEVLSSLSSSDALLVGRGEPSQAHRHPRASLVLDWIDILGLSDFSGCDRVLLADGEEELDEILRALADAAPRNLPRVVYSFSDALEGELGRDVLARNEEGMWWYAHALDDGMLLSALGASLSSKALRLYGISESLATGAASLSSPSREDLSRAVRVLSCGMMEIPPDAFSCWIESWELASFDERMFALARECDATSPVARSAEALRMAAVLEELLRSAWGSESGLFEGFTVTRDQMMSGFRRDDGEVSARLRANGIESFLDAALSGVPVDDLLM